MSAVNVTDVTTVYDPDDLIIAASVFQELPLGDIDEAECLSAIQSLTHADGVINSRWLPGDHAKDNSFEFGAPTPRPDCFKQFIDLAAKPVSVFPALIDTAEPIHQDLYPASAAYISGPRVMCVLMDNEPACILIILTRSPDSPHWGDAERQAFLNFAKIIRLSVRLHKRLDDLASIVSTAQITFNSMPGGLLSILPNGQVPIANRAAVTIMRKDDTLTLRDEHLVFQDKKIQADFLRNLSEITSLTAENNDDYSRHYLLKRTCSEAVLQLTMHVIRLPNWHFESRPSAMVILVYLTDPEEFEQPSIGSLKDIYGFTDAQARVAVALSDGTAIHDAANSLSISVNTTRTHLRAIYQKTGVSNHAELMTTMTSTLARLGSIGITGQYFRYGEGYVDC
jgi:DNA-binding CsgD family transcriptional regulator